MTDDHASGPPRLIVNADDLGRTPGVDAGIFEAHRRGLVTSATLMVGYPAAAAAAAEIARHPGLGVGLHLTLTGGGPPTLPAARVPSLVDGGGRLPRTPDGLAGADPAEVEAEVESQLARFLGLVGRPPTHLDSHHHSHRRTEVLPAVVAVARRHRLAVRHASPAVGERLRAAGVATTDRFVERFFGAEARLAVLLEILAEVAAFGPGTTELMCHPGRVDPALEQDSTYAADRETELAALTHPRALAAVRRHGLVLGRFGEA